MTDTPINSNLVAERREPAVQSYVEWGAIIAGAVLAAAISTLLTSFGAALGLTALLSSISSSSGAVALGVASALWAVWVGVSSFAAGGYLAGRMRRRVYDASEHESDVRDGSHGLIVWALGALLVALLATASLTGIVKGAGSVVASGGQAALSAPVSGAAEEAAARMFRSTNAADMPESSKKEVAEILTTTATNGSISEDDKSYLTSQIASRAGIAPAEASKRVDDAIKAMAAAEAKAKEAAETARKLAIVVGFLTAASLAISAAGAWYAAILGGKHRDEEIDLSHLM